MIIENFYNNPYEVREWALDMDFSVQGNYPGLRTESIGDPWFSHMKDHFEKLLNKKINFWEAGYNGAFQLTLENDNTWTHHDATVWAAVVFLTPNAPLESGTGIYRHKGSGIYYHKPDQVDYNEGGSTEEDWELIHKCSNIFNTCVLYHGDYYHRSILPGFGTDKESGRLFQTFFFDTETK